MLRNWKPWIHQLKKANAARKTRTPRRSGRFSGVVALGAEHLEDRRLLAAGDLDTTFNMGAVAPAMPGILISNLTLIDNGQSVAVQADGKILIAGTVQTSVSPASANFGVARYNSDGTLDTTFGVGDGDGVDGLATINFNPVADTDEAFDLAIDSFGRIVVVGMPDPISGSRA
jgi:uncharacterized delta-60 repeat protein